LVYSGMNIYVFEAVLLSLSLSLRSHISVVKVIDSEKVEPGLVPTLVQMSL